MTKPQPRVPRPCTVCGAIYIGHPLQLTCSDKCKIRRCNTLPKAIKRRREWYINNRERIKQHAAARELANPGARAKRAKQRYEKNKKEIRDKQHVYNRKNKEKISANKRAYYIENRERILANQYLRYLEDPTYAKLQAAKRKAKLDTPLPVKEWNEKLVRLNHQCVYCGTKENIQIDHIKPVAKGGTNHIDNLQPLCRACNALKSDKYPYEPPQEIMRQNV